MYCNFVLLVSTSLKYLVYLGMPFKTSNKGRLVSSSLNVIKNFLKQAYSLDFLSLRWYGGSGLSKICLDALVFKYLDSLQISSSLTSTCFFYTFCGTKSTYATLCSLGGLFVRALSLLKVINMICFGFFVSLGNGPWGLVFFLS